MLYTGLVRTGILALDQLIDKMAVSPRKRFGIPLREGDRTEWDLETRYTVNPDDFLSMGRATPFAGTEVYGRCLKTVHNGKTVYQYKSED